MFAQPFAGNAEKTAHFAGNSEKNSTFSLLKSHEPTGYKILVNATLIGN